MQIQVDGPQIVMEWTEIVHDNDIMSGYPIQREVRHVLRLSSNGATELIERLRQLIPLAHRKEAEVKAADIAAIRIRMKADERLLRDLEGQK